MKRLWHGSLVRWLIAVGQFGCATVPMPPSETTISIVKSYHNQLASKVASGHLTSTQARDLYYAKLKEITPPLPDLEKLLEFRSQAWAQIEAKALTPEQAETQLAARESEMLVRWEEMAAQDAQQQREFEQIKAEQERGLQQQRALERNTGIMNLPPR